MLDVRPRPTEPFEAALSLHPSTLIGVGLLVALYVWRARRGPERLEPWRATCFGLAMAVIVGSLNGPIHDLSDYYLFTIHMVQHLLLTLVMPPLLLAGIPGWMLQPLFQRRPVLRTARVLTHPVVAGGLLSATMIVWHTVPFYDMMMRSHDVHIATHILFMVTAVIMWWPVMSPSPELPPLNYGLRMLYLFLVGIPMQAVAAIITFADRPLYSWYVDAPRTWGLSALDDQKLGALLMWVPGNLYLWLAISVVFFRWARLQEAAEVAPARS